ncbi:hypothetical protein LTR17_025436, partial [Elasticomyces elasticus]
PLSLRMRTAVAVTPSRHDLRLPVAAFTLKPLAPPSFLIISVLTAVLTTSSPWSSLSVPYRVLRTSLARIIRPTRTQNLADRINRVMPAWLGHYVACYRDRITHVYPANSTAQIKLVFLPGLCDLFKQQVDSHSRISRIQRMSELSPIVHSDGGLLGLVSVEPGEQRVPFQQQAAMKVKDNYDVQSLAFEGVEQLTAGVEVEIPDVDLDCADANLQNWLHLRSEQGSRMYQRVEKSAVAQRTGIVEDEQAIDLEAELRRNAFKTW